MRCERGEGYEGKVGYGEEVGGTLEVETEQGCAGPLVIGAKAPLSAMGTQAVFVLWLKSTTSTQTTLCFLLK